MAIGIDDDLDFIDDDYEGIPMDGEVADSDNHTLDSYEGEIKTEDTHEIDEDFITSLLRTRGIEDKEKIKFETEDGNVEEVTWDSLSNEEKLNILNSSNNDSHDLQDDELSLINAIRQSRLSPSEYLYAIQKQGVDNYIQNTQNQSLVYKVDELSDEELFISDLLSRTPDITDEEAQEALERSKQNESLFKKQIGAMRSEYKRAEDELIQQQEFQQQQQAQDQYNQFAEQIENSIMNFTEFSGCDINMDREDMQELYDFITEIDATGVSHFGKVLNDPEWLVKVAWFALNGEKMINDISEYYKKEIANVRQESYNKGLQAGKDKPHVVHKTVQRTKDPRSFDDLDEF